jgi:hypothetical protein
LDCFGKLLAPNGAQERHIEKNGRRAHAIDPANDRPADEGEWPEYRCTRSSLEKTFRSVLTVCGERHEQFPFYYVIIGTRRILASVTLFDKNFLLSGSSIENARLRQFMLTVIALLILTPHT